MCPFLLPASLGHGFPLHGGAPARIALFSERLAQGAARLLRNPRFAPPLAGSSRRGHIALTPVDGLPSVARGAQAALFGALTQPEVGAAWASKSMRR